MQVITIQGVGTFEVPNDRVPEVIQFLRSLQATDVTEAQKHRTPTVDPLNRLILG